MKKKYFSLFCLLCFYSGFGQRFSTPAPGKSIVCFACTDKLVKAQIFEKDQYLETIGYLDYSIFEVDSGYHFFWVGSGNNWALFFLEASLEEGKTYIVTPKIKSIQYPGFTFQRFLLEPLSISDSSEYIRVKRLFKHFKPKETNEKKIAKMNKKIADYIQRKLIKYQNIKNEETHDQIGVLSPEQYIPIENLNQ